MNIIFVNWSCYCAEDTCLALTDMGHNVYVTQLSEDAKGGTDEVFIAQLRQLIQENHTNLVFSLNYYPSISIACEKFHCPYIAYIYDNPMLLAYDKSVTNECNYIFSFDSHMVAQLRSRGVETIYYMPLAANVKRMTSDRLTAAHYRQFGCDISFVGSLYNEKNDYYSRIIAQSDNPYLKGYLEGLLQAQKKVYGYNFLAECLTPDVIDSIRTVLAYPPDEGSFITESEIYADFYLAKKLATMERVELLYLLGNFFDVHLYTHKETPITTVKQRGIVHYYDEMPLLFRTSKINLNITLRSIKNGIPLRAMDILGCGGFLLSNFQEDFLQHFEPDVHLALYTSTEEALDKAQFYLSHDTERETIRRNALELMSREHTYEVRLQQMLNVVFP